MGVPRRDVAWRVLLPAHRGGLQRIQETRRGSLVGRGHHGCVDDPQLHQPRQQGLHRDRGGYWPVHRGPEVRRDHLREEPDPGNRILYREHLRAIVAAQRLRWTGLRAVDYGCGAGPGVPLLETGLPGERSDGLRAVLLHDHHDPAHSLPARSHRHLGRLRYR